MVMPIGEPTVNGHVYRSEVWDEAISEFMARRDRYVTLQPKMSPHYSPDIAGIIESRDGHEFEIKLLDTKAGKIAKRLNANSILPYGTGTLNKSNEIEGYTITAFHLVDQQTMKSY